MAARTLTSKLSFSLFRQIPETIRIPIPSSRIFPSLPDPSSFINQGSNLLKTRSLFANRNVVGNAMFRCMSTESRAEVSSEKESSIDVEVPQRIKFKRPDKTAKHIMNILDKEAVDKVRTEREIPEIKPGYIVQIKLEVPENKRRVSVIQGIVIARRNAGLNSTFRLRRMVAGVGVESVFPLYSPNLKEMKVLDKKKVRRAKLYYLRDRMNALKK